MWKFSLCFVLLSVSIANGLPIQQHSSRLYSRDSPFNNLAELENIKNHCTQDRNSLTNFEFNFPQFNPNGLCKPSSAGGFNLNNANTGVNSIGSSGPSIPGLGGSSPSVPGLGGSSMNGLGNHF
ncbi:hypothetical protein BDF19DRAFT_497066 [Syncephalis fuscata]|nr:hypothetical protein BDF19DRAFT_497066 [Syncephalis fuscata]